MSRELCVGWNMTDSQWLQEWLLENCNIGSDHYYGILIETIDNPWLAHKNTIARF